MKRSPLVLNLLTVAILIAAGIGFWLRKPHAHTEQAAIVSPETPVSVPPHQELFHPLLTAKADDSKIPDSSATMKEWVAFARRMSDPDIELSPDEGKAMCWFLEHVSMGKERHGEESLLKNELMNRLGEQGDPKLFASSLLAIESDPKQPAVLRDYALQQLSSWYDSYPDKAAVNNAFWTTAGDPKSLSQGTALLALSRLKAEGKLADQDPQRLDTLATTLVSDPKAPDSARMTALDILRTDNATSAVAAARQLLSGDHSVAVLITAIGTLGQHGSAEDATLLRQSGIGRTPGLEPAVQLAIKTLEQKTNIQ